MNLSQAGIAGIVLAVVGILLFIGIYFGLQSLGVGDFPRLMLALCAPPALMAVVIGAYLLLTARQTPDEESKE